MYPTTGSPGERWSVCRSPGTKRERPACDVTPTPERMSRSPWIAEATWTTALFFTTTADRIVVVIRPPEPALVIRIAPTTDHRTTLQMAALIGHAFGNQHVPLEVLGNEIRLPVTTSESVMRGTLEQLHLHDLSFDFESIRLGPRGPLTSGAGHGGHDH